MKPPAFRAAALLAMFCLATAAGCGEAVAPEAAPPSDAAPREALLGSLLVNVLQRATPLAANVSTSAVIGEAGGTLRIPAAGLTLAFPRGAVSEPVTVRATALAGGNVAYRLEPHGLVFARDVVVQQDLGLTEVVSRLLSLSLEGAYVPDESQLASGTAVVTETQPAQLDLLRLRMSFNIRHFSAYVASSGRRGGYITSTGDRTTGPQAPLVPSDAR